MRVDCHEMSGAITGYVYEIRYTTIGGRALNTSKAESDWPILAHSYAIPWNASVMCGCVFRSSHRVARMQYLG